VALAYDGLCTFEFGIAVEVFGLPRPEMEPGWYRFAVAAAQPGPLRARGGFTVQVDGGLELLATASCLPSFRFNDVERKRIVRTVRSLRKASNRLV